MAQEIHFPSTMGNADALMWRVEEDPLLRSTAAAVTLLDHAPEKSALLARLGRATCEIPRLRQRVVSPPSLLSNPVWSEDPYFDLDYHLRYVRAPRDGSFRSVLDLAASLTMQGFDRTRPLWEFVVVEDMAGGRAALIQKLHHAVTDGMAGLLLMKHLYESEPDLVVAEGSPVGEPTRKPRGALRIGADAFLRNLAQQPEVARRRAARVLGFALRPYHSTRQAVTDLASIARVYAPALWPLSPIMRERSTRYRFDTLSVPLEPLKSAAHAAGCKLNDAFLAAVAGGWHLYHERHGVDPESLRVTLPISLRKDRGVATAGNQFTVARFRVPLREPDPKRRMRAMRDLVAAQRSEPGLGYAEDVAALLNRAPGGLTAELFAWLAKSNDFVASCVPGPADALYVAGARVASLFAFGPPAGTAANITLFSYLGRANVTINADPAAIPDHETLVGCMSEGFDEVLKVA
jgi:WS/DGAT/MGAT family acyltransferase